MAAHISKNTCSLLSIYNLHIFFGLYNFIVNTSKWVFFLPPSDAYVRSFLYLLYTLIKLYYTHTHTKREVCIQKSVILLCLVYCEISISLNGITSVSWNLSFSCYSFLVNVINSSLNYSILYISSAIDLFTHVIFAPWVWSKKKKNQKQKKKNNTVALKLQ